MTPMEVVDEDRRDVPKSQILLVCEHAGKTIPRHLGDLGLDEDSLKSHIAWDIGARNVVCVLSGLLNAPYIVQEFSRLVVDCNRPTTAEDAIPVLSECTIIPGNQRLSRNDRLWRLQEIYYPFEKAIENWLDEQSDQSSRPIIVTIHTFTSTFKGRPRETDLGLLFNSDDRLARSVYAQRTLCPDYLVQLNRPYGPKDGVMHTLEQHPEPRGLLHLMIEIRNNHVDAADGQKRWGHILAKMLQKATDSILQPR